MSKGVLLMKEKQHKKINKFLMEKAYSDHIKEKGGRIPPAKSPELSGLSATYTAMPSWFPVMTRSLKEKAKKVVYAIIGVACSIVSDITNGKYKLLKWDKQERKYYPIEINLHERGNIDDDRF